MEFQLKSKYLGHRSVALCGALVAAWAFTCVLPSVHAQAPSTPFKIAFVSNREHYWYPHVYLYEHDGDSTGKMIGSIDPQDKRLDHQPVLNGDGKICVFGLELEAQVGQLQMWDLTANKSRDFGDLFGTTNALFSPSLSLDGSLLTLSAWNRPGSSPRWDVLLFDLTERKPIDLPGLSTAKYDERFAAISGNGQCLAFTTNEPTGRGLTDVRVFDRRSNHALPLLEMNSPATDTFPKLDLDGRLVCFASDREGGEGGFDVYLFDRTEQRFVSLPGLNSPGHEQTPSLSPDGRFIAFVSERFDSAGEHDIFVYDRLQSRLLVTPNLNTDRDDYDPCLMPIASAKSP